MKILDRMVSVWSDLDASYEKMSDQLKVNSKKDFLFKLCGFDGHKDNIDGMKSALNNESSTYTKEEFDKYTEFIKILDSLKLVLTSIKTDVENLNDFINVVVNHIDESNEAVRLMPENFMDKFLKPQQSKLTTTTPDEIFRMTGDFRNNVKIDENGQALYYYSDPLQGSDIFTMDTPADLQNLIALNKELNGENKNLRKALLAIKYLMGENVAITDILSYVFVANTFYVKKDETFNLVLNNKDYKIKREFAVNDNLIYSEARIKGPAGFIPVILLP